MSLIAAGVIRFLIGGLVGYTVTLAVLSLAVLVKIAINNKT